MSLTAETSSKPRGGQNLENLVQLLLARLGKSILLSIGDSHSRLFSNLENIKVYHVGPATAFNLVNANSSTKAGKKINEILDNYSPSEAAILLSFGEIDIRVHVIKAAINNRKTIKECALQTAKLYSAFISQIVSRGYSVLIMGVHASGLQSAFKNKSFPAVGRQEDRNFAVKQFNESLRGFCISQSIPYASLDSIVIDSNLKTRNEYICDGCHLNLYPEIQAILIYQFLTSVDSARTEHQQQASSREKFDISRNKPFRLTSSFNSILSGYVSRGEPYFFRTNTGFNQGIEIDLQERHIIDSIRIENRTDYCHEKAKALCVILFDNDVEVCRIDIPNHALFLNRGGFISIEIPKRQLSNRVLVYSKANTCLHFSDINVYTCLPPLG